MEAAIRTFGPGQLGPGDAYLEFGVYVGTSMACMYRAARRAGASTLRLIGFDSFQGMPPDDGLAIPTWQPSQLYADIRLTRANLKRQGIPASRVQLVRGWYEDSLTAETRERLNIDRAAIIMMDCVLESSTRKALEFCAPLIRDRAVIFFDDWSAEGLAERGMGESRAFSDWLAAHPEMIAEDAPDLRYESDARPFVVRRRVVEEPQSGKLAQPTGSAAGRS
jgi:predicted O-methyltransferase YrrM